MIAASNDPGACGNGEDCGDDGFVAMFTECCQLSGDEESCTEWEGELFFPRRNCDFLGIALAMPTCWNGQNDSDNHKSHMAYTTNGQVNGDCPSTHNRRLPQIQVFVRIPNYRGSSFQYVLADGNTISGRNGAYNFHTDFFNGWEEGKFQEIIDNCQPYPNQEAEGFGYNPPCDCTPREESNYDGGLTVNDNVPETVCDADVKRLIVDEEIKRTTSLPVYSGSCQGEQLIPRSWTDLTADLFSTDCNDPISTSITSSSTEPPPTGTTSTAVTTVSTSITSTTTAVSCYPSGRKVKIFSLYGNLIHMFEVKVISGGVNVARGKSARQSSTLRNKFHASRAVDGNLNSFSHTNSKGVQWWEVDLEEAKPIESVVIGNRFCRDTTDAKGCLCRLGRAVISILDENDNWVASQFLGDTCGQLQVTVEFPCIS
jgi:hypothetical protein